MILNISILSLILSAFWVNDVSGAPYSNVYFQSNSAYSPVEYIQYSPPSVSLAGGQISQLSAPPVRSALPVPSYVSPCGSTCLVSGQNIAPIAPAANLITYKSPISSVPVALPRDETTSYQYSYIVYDDHTGDQKAQHEQSDGSVVRGEYSLVQPDGYVREVQYVADDTNGFNAIVKNFLPTTLGGSKKVEHINPIHPAPPCTEVKNDNLAEEAQGPKIAEHVHRHEALIEAHNEKEGGHHDIIKEVHVNHAEHRPHHAEHHARSETEHHENVKSLQHSPTKDLRGHSEDIHHGHTGDQEVHIKVTEYVITSEDSEHPESRHSHTDVTGHGHPGEHSAGLEEQANMHQDKVEGNQGHDENISQGHTEEHSEHEKESGESDSSENSSNESLERTLFFNALKAHNDKSSESDESSGETGGHSEEPNLEHVNEPHTEHEHQSENHHTRDDDEAEQHHEVQHPDTNPASIHHEDKHSEQLKEHGQNESTQPIVVHEHTKEETQGEINGVAYSDVIRCVNAAMNNVPSSHNAQPSPLTYIILNKPC